MSQKIIKTFKYDHNEDSFFIHSIDKKQINKDSLYESDFWFYKTNKKADLRFRRGVSADFLQKKIYSRLDEFGVALDIGARVGEWSRLMGQRFEKIIAFEPRKKWCECFVKNVKMNNIDLYNYAASSGSFLGKMNGSTITSMINSETNCDESYNIKSCSIDSLNIDRVDFIKVDTDGHELLTLKGAANTILKSKPLIFTESIENKWYFGDSTYVKHCEYLEGLGMVLIEEFRESNGRLHDRLYGWET